jgi:hypothetical protein
MLQRTQMLKPGEKRVSDNGKWRLEVLQTGEVTVRPARDEHTHTHVACETSLRGAALRCATRYYAWHGV